MVKAGFEGVDKYSTRRQNTVAQYIAMRPILDLCKWSARRPGEMVSRRWCEHASLDLEGAKKRAAAASEAVDSDREDLIGEEEGMPLELQWAGIEGGGMM